MKRKRQLILALMTVLAVFLGGAKFYASSTGQCGDNVFWSLDTETGVVTISGTGPMWDYNTTSNPSPFSTDQSVTGAVIQYGVSSVGSWFFNRCNSLTSVRLTTSVLRIGSGAFYNCGLSAVEIPERLTEIGSFAFAYNGDLAQADLAPTVTQIGESAFRYTDLTEVLIPYTVTSIGDRSFGNCTVLTEAAISGPDTSISSTAFSDCSAGLIIRGYTGSTAQSFASAGGYTFGPLRCGDSITADILSDGCSLVLSGTGAMWNFGPGTAHRYSPFDRNSVITTLYMSDDITRIGSGSFPYCDRLATMNLPDGLLAIGSWAFQACNALTTPELPESLASIGPGAFRYCAGLTSLTIPAGVPSLSSDTFTRCSRLAHVTIRNRDLLFQGADIFEECPSSMVLHGYEGSTTQTYAGEQGIAFEPFLSSGTCGPNLTWTLDMDTGLLTIDGSGPMTDYNNTYESTRSPFFENPDIRSVTMTYAVTSVGKEAFEGCTNLTSVSLPIGLTSIGTMAFYNCGLTGDLQIPYGTEIIGSSAFKFNPLTRAVIPCSVTTIDHSVFENCGSLYEVEIHNPSASIGYNVFRNCHPFLTLRCFSGATAESYASTFDLRSGRFRVGDGITCDMDAAGNVTVSGSGEMYNYSFYTGVSPLYGQTAAKTAVLSDGITSVGRCFFCYCSSMTDVTLPAGLLRIEHDAFDYCRSLRSVNIPDTVTFIGSEAFMESKLTQVDIPAATQWLVVRAFGSCHDLEAVTIRNPRTEIDDEVFFGSTASFTLYGWAGSTTETFAHAHGIPFIPLAAEPDLVLPADLMTIDEEAFSGIAAGSVLIPDTVTTINGDPFEDSAVTIIFGYPGSAAQTFAGEYGYGFVPVGE